ncbi:MAG TPA: DUF5781 family protein [Candidatus Saccharimonadales bacterium]|nr:DUF5781 family protein [Candidatus Saccharimonadales bacterium]
MINRAGDLMELKEDALDLMHDAGFAIENVTVVLDEKLPYMGHTVQVNGAPVVVVSGMALKSGMALNLLIHEFGHVYRTQSAHPSHDSGLILSAISFVMHGKVVPKYQEEVLYAIINHLEDLYSDDIFFKIFDSDRANVGTNKFFLGWIHKPVKKVKNKQDSWTNAEFLLSAAFADANLHRHNIKDVDGLIRKAVEEFLSKIDKRMSIKYNFFKNLMVNLPEKVNEKEYERLLISYLSEFLKIAKLK